MLGEGDSRVAPNASLLRWRSVGLHEAPRPVVPGRCLLVRGAAFCRYEASIVRWNGLVFPRWTYLGVSLRTAPPVRSATPLGIAGGPWVMK